MNVALGCVTYQSSTRIVAGVSWGAVDGFMYTNLRERSCTLTKRQVPLLIWEGTRTDTRDIYIIIIIIIILMLLLLLYYCITINFTTIYTTNGTAAAAAVVVCVVVAVVEVLYIKENIPAYEVQLSEEADYNEAIWCKLVTGPTTVIMGVVYRCPNITKQNNEKIHNAISEVSKGEFSIMGDFNHEHIKWDTQQSTGVEDHKLLCLVQDNFLTQHVLEPTRAAIVLYIVLSSQKEFVDNVVIQEQLGSSDHNQLHFNINIKSDKTKVKQCRRYIRRGNYEEIRTSLALIDWNDKMYNNTF